MGVKDLWKLLEPAGRPVKLESLEGLILAVDVSIWLNQAVKGMRDRHGEPLPNAHLVVLFNRICKLLHYHIKPVFVFDGATPVLKQQTLVARSHKREVAVQRSLKASDKYLTKYLQAKILEQMTGEGGSIPAPIASRATASQPDMFELPPLAEDALSKEKSPYSELNDPNTSRRQSSVAYYNDVATADIHSEDFNSLPPEVQHELLLERQEIEKYSYHNPATLPKVADDFSNYQISRLMKRSNISKKLRHVRKVLKSNDAAVIGLGEESKVHEVESSRIMSSESTHYILVKGTDMDSQSSQDEGTCDEGENSSSGRLERDRDRDEPVVVAEPEMGDDDVRMTNRRRGRNVRRFVDDDDDDDESSGVDMDVSKNESIECRESQGTSGLEREMESSFESKEVMLNSAPLRERQVESSNSFSNEVIDRATDKEHVNVSDVEKKDVRECSVSELDKASDGEHHSLIDVEKDTVQEHSEEDSFKDTNVVVETHLESEPEKDLSGKTVINLVGDDDDAKNTSPRPPSHNDGVEPFQLDISKSQLKVLEAIQKDDDNVLAPSSKKELEEVIDLTQKLTQDDEKVSTQSVPRRELISKTQAVQQMSSSIERTVMDMERNERQGAFAIRNEESSSSGEESGREDDTALLLTDPGEAQKQLGHEALELEREMTQQNRAAASVSSQMYKDIQELLSLFGLPYLVAPMEAEAQCAALDVAELTHGTITDDNDVFLFGGRKVYRNFFSKNREVEVYSSSEVDKMLGLSRDSLIVLAYLLGSDYTEGLEGVGIVSAMELLRDFQGNGLEPLNNDWHNTMNAKPGLFAKESGQRKKLIQLVLPTSFPSLGVQEAYLSPEVDDSKEEFEWGKPDLDLIRKYALERMGWNQDKVDDILLPVLKRLNTKEPQKKISQFFSSSHDASSSHHQRKSIKSQRIRNVVARLTNTDSHEDAESQSSTSTKGRGRGRGRGRGKRTRNTTKSKQVAKRTKRNTESPSDTITTQSPPPRSKLSASSSSSSEDEFDNIVRNWDFEDEDQIRSVREDSNEREGVKTKTAAKVAKRTHARKKRI